MKSTFRIKLGAALAPTEFRLFVKGANETEKGKFVFDDAAARSVMAAYKAWGIDVPIDLEHQMMGGPGSDPTQRDARGWCKLELRPDGSLWATKVSWTADGLERLTQKRQRYISPCFEADPKTRRILKMLSIAITALPATHNTPALVAASIRKLNNNMDIDTATLKSLYAALQDGDSDTALNVLQRYMAGAGIDPKDIGGAAPVTDGTPSEQQAAPGTSGVHGQLTGQQLAICRKLGCDPKDFATVQRAFFGGKAR